MTTQPVSRRNLIAVVVVLVAALILRSALRLHLQQNSMASALAADLSYLIVPPIIALLIALLWRTDRDFLVDQFRCSGINTRLVLQAVAIGVLLRTIWWSQLIAGVSFGWYRSNVAAGPSFSFDCGPAMIVLLGIVVMVLCVPIIEELLHRAYVQTYFYSHGVLVAILISSCFFAVLHRFDTWAIALFAGIVLGIQYWATASLWPSLISHMTYNGLTQIDWRCLSGRWTPQGSDLPVLVPGVTATTILLASVGTLTWLLWRLAAGATHPPRQH